ncbi:MAG: MFS transporter [Anaerolineae bacterium]
MTDSSAPLGATAEENAMHAEVDPDLTPSPDYPWNARAFVAETALLVIAMAFVSTTTVLPAFIEQLTGSTVMVGIVSGLLSGAWLLPQLFAAGAVARMPLRKPFMMWVSWIGRCVYVPVAILIVLLGSSNLTATLVVVVVGTVAFSVFDAILTVPWFDLFAQAIPPKRRGRVTGVAMVIAGVAGVGVGELVRLVLGERSPWGFPGNYAFLFAAASVFLLLSAAFLSLVRERPLPAASERPPTLRQILSMLPSIVLRDRPFLRLNAVRLLGGFVALASAFYVLHAVRNLGLPLEVAGTFVVAQIVGSLVAGLLTAALQDRFGPLIHLRVVTALSALPPLIALIAQPFAGTLGQAILYPYLAVFFCLGLYTGSFNFPYYNWILEYVGQERRSLYIGVGNTLGAITMLAPPLGGWLAERFSYPVAFAAAVLFVVTAMLASLGLPDTRKC